MSKTSMPLRWLVTGAAGFIGSNICEYLLDHGCEIIAVDNLSSGSSHNVTLLQHKSPKNFHFFRLDIRDAQTIDDIFGQYRPDRVLHLAAMVSVPRCQQNLCEAHDINVTGFLNILNSAKKNHVTQFIYASSSAVYGKQPDGAISEAANVAPLSFYGTTKLVNELYATELATVAFQCVGLRLFNIFGPRQPTDGGYAAVIPTWKHCLKNHLSVHIFGDGSQTRDFCHVMNVAHAIEQISKTHFLIPHTVLNIGTGQAIDLLSLYEALFEAHNIEVAAALDFAPAREGDILHSRANIAKAVELIDYNPNCDLISLLRE